VHVPVSAATLPNCHRVSLWQFCCTVTRAGLTRYGGSDHVRSLSLYKSIPSFCCYPCTKPVVFLLFLSRHLTSYSPRRPLGTLLTFANAYHDVQAHLDTCRVLRLFPIFLRCTRARRISRFSDAHYAHGQGTRLGIHSTLGADFLTCRELGIKMVLVPVAGQTPTANWLLLCLRLCMRKTMEAIVVRYGSTITSASTLPDPFPCRWLRSLTVATQSRPRWLTTALAVGSMTLVNIASPTH
jgi:hypothetical protein